MQAARCSGARPTAVLPRDTCLQTMAARASSSTRAFRDRRRTFSLPLRALGPLATSPSAACRSPPMSRGRSLIGAFCLALVLICQLDCARAAYCSGAPSPNAQPNLNPVNLGLPVLVNVTANGKLYVAGTGQDIFHILHVYGTPYEMGYAHGTLLKPQILQFIPRLFDYLGTQATIPDLPKWLSDIVVTEGIEAGLAATALITARYTPQYFFEELQGMANATGLPYNKLLWLHMIGELTKGACSMYGAWGQAIPTGNDLLQMRALDWDVNGPYKDYPTVVVYHPEEGNGHSFANVGFASWIGSITGMSSVPMAVNEIGVTFPDASFGEESRFGIPFTFLIRDILQFDLDLDDSINRLANAARTCDLILGVGDGNFKTFRSFEYSFSVMNVIDDVNLLPVNDTWHPPITNVVYHGMDWLCPGFNLALSEQLRKYWGNLTAEISMRYITPIVQTGNLHVAVYDYSDLSMYLAFAAGTSVSGPPMAYDRTFTKLNMTALWNEPAPTAQELQHH